MIGFSLERLAFHCRPKCISKPDNRLRQPFRYRVGSRWYCCASDGHALVAVRSLAHRQLAKNPAPGMSCVGPLLTKPEHVKTAHLGEFKRWLGKPPRVKDRVQQYGKSAINDCDRVRIYGAPFDAQVVAYALRMPTRPDRVRMALMPITFGYELGIWGDDWIVLAYGLSEESCAGKMIDRTWPGALQ